MSRQNSLLRWTRGEGATASGRKILEGLAASGGKLAWVGLVASLVTLGFMLYFQDLIRRQAEVGEPLSRASMKLESSIIRSVAQLRGFIAYREPSAKKERAKTWVDIEASLEELFQAAQRAKDDRVGERAAQLRKRLRRLKVLQWTVEDLANSPGNNPALEVYKNRLEPLRRAVLNLLEGPLEFGDSGRVSGAVGDRSLMRFRALFVETDASLVELLRSHSPAAEASLQRKLQGSEAVTYMLSAVLEEARGAEPTIRKEVVDDSIDMLRAAVQKAEAYHRMAREVLVGKERHTIDRARTLFRTRIRPELKKATALAQELAREQARLRRRHGQRLYRFSFLVLGLSVLMGIISATSIYLSARLESRMRTVLSRAKSLGQYELQERIGGGGMGEVYRGQHAMLRRPCAIKLLRSERMKDPESQERFQREVQLTASLHHPNTIAIFDYGKTDDGIFYYVMELLRGATLDTLVDTTGPVPPHRAIHILTQVCSSLAEAHDKGLLHRDVKPSNVMLTELGGMHDVVKVLDFGLVAEVEAGAWASERETIVGTPMYLAPETIRSGAAASARSDVYAIGAVGFHLLTGTPLFELNDVESVLHAQLESMPDRPSHRLGMPIPDELEVLILGCLAKDPDDRPESAHALRDMLQQVDVPQWTERDAALWWSTYGEAVIAESKARDAAQASGSQGQTGGARDVRRRSA